MELKDCLDQALRANTLLEVRTDSGLEDGRLKVGYLVSVREDFVLLQELEQDGTVDCLTYIDQAEICLISTKTQYLQKSVFADAKKCAWPKELEGAASLAGFLEAVKATARECSIHIRPGSRMLVGSIVDVSATCVTVAEVDRHGQPDGETTLPLSIIWSVDVRQSSLESTR